MIARQAGGVREGIIRLAQGFLRRLRSTRRLFSRSSAIFNSSEVQQRSAAVLIHVPTSDGSGEACHPSVLEIADGFAGYRYWMANTPYPRNAHKLENPELFASHDGIFWEVPDGVRNPLVETPAGGDRHYNSDPCLLHDYARLLLYFRSSDEESRPRHDRISVMSSDDGREWSQPRVVLDDNSGALLLCPIVRVIGGVFMMWTVEYADSPQLRLCRRVSSDGLGWSEPEVCSIEWPGEPLEPWHFDVMQRGDHLVMIFSARKPGLPGTQRFFNATGDGLVWRVKSSLPGGSWGFDSGKAYKPSLIAEPDANLSMWLYTSSTGADGHWYTALRTLGAL